MPEHLYRISFLRDHFVRRVMKSASAVVLLPHRNWRRTPQFVPGVHFRVIANGMSISPELKRIDGVRRGPLRLSYLGRLVATKGVAECIEAARLLMDSGRDFTLTIAGNGPQEAELRAQAAPLVEMGISARGSVPIRINSGARLTFSSFPRTMRKACRTHFLRAWRRAPFRSPPASVPRPTSSRRGYTVFRPARHPRRCATRSSTLDDDREGLLRMSQECMSRIHQDYNVERLSSEFAALYRSLVPEDPEAVRPIPADRVRGNCSPSRKVGRVGSRTTSAGSVFCKRKFLFMYRRCLVEWRLR